MTKTQTKMLDNMARFAVCDYAINCGTRTRTALQKLIENDLVEMVNALPHSNMTRYYKLTRRGLCMAYALRLINYDLWVAKMLRRHNTDIRKRIL